MSTTVREPEQKDFTPAPEGLHLAVCADVWPIWTEKRHEEWGGGLQDKTMLVWHIEDLDPLTGKPFAVYKRYTASLHEKANLRHDLESWRGKKFSPEELKSFELERLIGVNCQIQVLHKEGKNGKTYANAVSIVPAGKGQAKIVVAKDYIRKKDREEAAKVEPLEEEGEDRVPFSFLLPVLLPLLTLGSLLV